MALANPHTELDARATHDVIVIGSGYGAGICAARLAESGARVIVLERGREFSVSANQRFPEKSDELSDNVQIDGGPFGASHRLGLFNFHISRDLDVLVGCGLGGTSLINANVSIKPDPRVFELPMWPADIRAEAKNGTLEGYYQRALDVLDPKPFPDRTPVPRKLLAMEANGAKRCHVNVQWEKGKNSVGVEQEGCECCGDCTTGCNNRAKKTLCFTYLPLAKAFGAKIFVQCDVRHLAQRAGGLWEVHVQRLVDGCEEVKVTDVLLARRVIVGAGVMGTAGILLRSKALGLPISDELGGRVSGNGDALALAYDCDEPLDSIGFGSTPDPEHPVGPTILGVIDKRDTEKLEDGIIIEEGAFPSGVSKMMRVLVQAIASYSGSETGHGFLHWFHERVAEGRDLLGPDRKGALDRTIQLLIMGHDGADGIVELDDHDRPTIRWPQLHERKLFRAENALARAVATKLGGMFVTDPLATPLFLNNLLTVHPLGGCPMGDDPKNAVVDARGRVYSDSGTKLDGLYIADGSVVPTSLGVNPLLTICALAERIAEYAAKEMGLAPKASRALPPGITVTP